MIPRAVLGLYMAHAVTSSNASWVAAGFFGVPVSVGASLGALRWNSQLFHAAAPSASQDAESRLNKKK